MSEPLALKCPNCSAHIKFEHCNPERGTATCAYCGSLITLPGHRPTTQKQRLAVPLPPGMTIDQNADGTVITRRWFSAVHIFLIFFCVTWDGFLLFWYGMAFKGDAPWIMVLFPIAHVAVGVGLTYFTLAGLLNRTWIRISNGIVSILHGPLPWRGNVAIPTAEIDQFYCKRKITHGKNGPSETFELWLARRDGATQRLLSGMLGEDQAIYIEQQMEKALGITDRTMPGELPG